MVGLRLLDAARAAGLTVTAQDDRLVIRGPKRADQLARQLLANKAAVLAALAGPSNSLQGGQLAEITDFSEEFVPSWEDCPELTDSCPTCASHARWWNPLGESRCQNCDPPAKALRLLERVERIRQQDKAAVDEDLLDDPPLE